MKPGAYWKIKLSPQQLQHVLTHLMTHSGESFHFKRENTDEEKYTKI